MTTKIYNANLPSIDVKDGLTSYLAQIKRFPMLTKEEEYAVAKNWKDRGDIKSVQKLQGYVPETCYDLLTQVENVSSTLKTSM